ncbi:MAG: type II secretion system F family protein [Candidatus Omnitrophota bacterium]
MARLSYVARDKDGNKVTGTEEAADSEALITKLQNQGLLVVELKPFEQSLSEVRFKLKNRSTVTHHRVKINDMVMFAKQLATMLDAGVTLLRSLEVINQQVESAVLSHVLEEVIKDLSKGASFSSALTKHPRIFGQFWVSLIEVGEASGNLPVILEKLAAYLEAKANFQSKLVSALLYPGVLLLVSLGAVGFFASVIIPRFSEIFKSLNVTLPFLTRKILDFFEFIRTKFLLLLAGGAGIIFLFRHYRRTETGKSQLEALILRLPVFGNFYRVLIIERFTSQLAILIESGVPILYALEITERMVVSHSMSKIVENIKNQVREGKLIAEPMSKSGFFNPMVVQMVLIGEETGELDKMLKRVATFYQSYIETFVGRLSTLIEPFMLVFMGFIVGTIVIAMFMPIFSLASGGLVNR